MSGFIVCYLLLRFLRVDEIIKFSELEDFIDAPVRTYSSGMYMRLAFSVAINVDAEILLIDEILAVGDQHFQDKCFAKLEEYVLTGASIKSSNSENFIISSTLLSISAAVNPKIDALK